MMIMSVLYDMKHDDGVKWNDMVKRNEYAQKNILQDEQRRRVMYWI